MAINIAENLQIVKEQIEASAKKAARDPKDIQLIAVTKTVDVETINEAINLGVQCIGENKVQELTEKYDHIGEKVKYHMIGHLQKNKVKYIIDKVELIHSLDSYELALEIEKRAKNIEKVVDCLLQVNVSGEESKFGVAPEEAVPLLKKISELEHLHITGLMTMAPYMEDTEDARIYFKRLKTLSEEIDKMNLTNIDMEYLSMGMSNDFEVAIEEGANLVRVGSRIFGERNY
ncbi:MAG: YggS family pyridoxal phosphate-dependent enzyme [Clostridiaceae bacterium]|nr:YggS family pyridoxal phosphate-dependent enzyme [Clostridiaceae bacterium]